MLDTCSASLSSVLHIDVQLPIGLTAAGHGAARYKQALLALLLLIMKHVLPAVYVYLSHRLFLLTNTLKSVLIPSSKIAGPMWRNLAILSLASGILYLGGMACLFLTSSATFF